MAEPDDDARTPVERIRAEIARVGPIGFDRFMELALYAAGGFFQRERSPVGPDSDFVTSPHVHAFVFSRCVRAALLEAWDALGEPDPLEIVELGAGDGTFADSLLEAFAELPLPEIRYTGVELGDGAREHLRARGLHAVASIDEVGPFDGVVFANELIDNVPFRLGRREGDTVIEIRIGVDARGALVRVPAPWPDAPITVDALADGEEAAVPASAVELIASLAARLRRGVAVLVDYGERGPAGLAHGYVRHRAVEDVLRDPGSTDVTAGVDIDALADLARSNGLVAFEPVRQTDALAALGFGRWDATMRDRQAAGGTEAVAIWEARSRASILVDRERLGALWWLVLTTPGLPRPAWLERALERRSAD